MKNKFFRQKELNSSEQLESIKYAHCKILEYQFIRTELRCIIELQPVEYSRIYKLELKYDLNTYSPRKVKIWVIEPELKLPKNLANIHIWPASGDLCLFYGNEWTPCKAIGKTIIPWATKWLLFYEAWEVTGKWLGGGIHPSSKSKPNKRDKEKSLGNPKRLLCN